MMKVAVKLLSYSDRSFFKVHLKLSKQKAINLNADVFIDRLYPGLRGAFTTIGFPLVVVGPGGRSAHRLMRKALRTKGGKNWRLNGEFIHDPEDEPGRYDNLQDNDFAILAFDGTERPENVTMVLVSATEDPAMHEVLATLGLASRGRSMREISETTIAALRAKTIDAYPGVHPLDALVFRDTIEEVLFGGAEPAAPGAPPGAPPTGLSVPMSPDDLSRQMLAAGETGERGEELFERWLVTSDHSENDYEWVSLTYARSAFDFHVRTARWIEGAPHVYIDVKTSRGSFDNPIHMSIAQVRFASVTPSYRIARIYELDGGSPKLKILNNVDVVAADILAQLDGIPAGVLVESFQIAPSLFEVEHEATLDLDEP